MHATRPTNSLRLLIPIAAAALLAALLLLPAPVRAQDTTAPSLLVARVSGTSLVLVYDEALKTDSVPAASAYSVAVGGATGVAPSSVAVSGARVTLTLSAATTASTTPVTVTYTKPSSNPLQDLAAGTPNDAAALSGHVVTNNNATTNAQPVFSSATTTRSVAENTASGMNVGAVLTAMDDGTLTYGLVGPDASSFTIDTTSGQIQTSDALDFEDTDTYSVVVSVSDGMAAAGGMESDPAVDDAIVVTINVTNVNEAPVLAAGGESITRPENTSAGTVLHTFMASDEDGTTNFQWSYSGVDAGPFSIISNFASATLSFSDTLDYEMPTDSNGDNVYEIEVRASDGSLSATQNVTITITDVNEPPVITTTGTSHTAISVPEGTATSEVLATYTATDPDNGAVLTWTLTGTDADEFTFVGGVLKFKSVPDFESGADNVYEVTVNVSDGSLSDTQPVTITVTDVNEPPVITSGPTTKNVAENTTSVDSYTATDVDASDTRTWSKETGQDSGLFTINPSNGALRFSTAPNYEAPNQSGSTLNEYVVTVRVTDGGGLFDTRTVTITVTNVDEAGTASFTGTLSGGSTQTASVTDPDGSISSESYQWQRGDTSGGNFPAITTNATGVYVPVAADVGKYLRVKVSYTDAEGSGKSATSISRGPIGASNSEPTFDDGMSTMRTLPENSGLGVNVVGGVTAAMDSDSDTLTYSLAGTAANKFEVDANGQIKTKSTGSAQTFNFEDASNNSFSVTVRVHDGKDAAGGNSTAVDDTIAVTINLTNVNEAPLLTSPPTTLSKPENSTAVHSYAATDVDAGTAFSWSLNGTDAGKFEISSTGVLTFKNPLDFETPTDTGDIDMDNIYVVTVKVEDDGSPMMEDRHTLRLTVTNINEAPDITSTGTTFTAPSFDENGTSVVATYTATDVDANSNLTWSVEDNDFGDFNMTKNADGDGVLMFKAPPNYEAPIDADTNNTYSLTVKVKDNHSGNLTDTLNVVVTVNDVNETPVISGGAMPSFAEIEFDVVRMDLTLADLTVTGSFEFYDDDGDDVTWSVSGDDGGHFDITKNSDGSSFIHFKNASPGTDLKPANFEVPVDMSSANDYDIVLQARDDNSMGALTGTFAVTVTVTQVDETPEITSLNPTHTFPEIEYDYVHAATDLNGGHLYRSR